MLIENQLKTLKKFFHLKQFYTYCTVVIKLKQLDFLHYIFVDNFFARHFCNFFNKLEASIE